ncbi:MAG: adenine phosphoribosyltransferase [Gemmatimonadota bacterium]
MSESVASYIRTIPDYPKPGILFRDVTTLIADPTGFGLAIDELTARYEGRALDVVVGVEARGFIFGAALASRLGVGFVPVRKPGKLPGEVIGEDYELEYGTDRLEVHVDAVEEGARVLLVDDLIATGGTATAALVLLRRLGAEVAEACFVVDLPDLGGARRLQELGCPCHALCAFEGH